MLWNELTSRKKDATGWCVEIDQEMDAILLIIGIAYGVCRIGLFFLFLSEFVNEAGLPASIPCISFGSDWAHARAIGH